jgi:proton-translocating NADH-quinone oxidoreductase chain M
MTTFTTLISPIITLLLLPLFGILGILFLSPREAKVCPTTPAAGFCTDVAPQGPPGREAPQGRSAAETRLHEEGSHSVGIETIRPSESPLWRGPLKERDIALITATLVWFETLRLFLSLDFSSCDFQFIVSLPFVNLPFAGAGPSSILLGVDGISIWYLLLTAFLFPICILASYNIKWMLKEYYIALLSLLFLLIGVFTVLDLVGFYILFEGVLIPMYLIIGVWGAREQKITAAYYFFFYTLVGSVLMLLSILYLYQICGTTDLIMLYGLNIDPSIQRFLFLGFFISLAVKIPKFPFHIWLPQAHVEAPLAGSILLAGILIKLGSYGFLRYVLPIFPEACVYFTPLVYTLGVLAIIYASLTTLRQTDLKRIIAYSSVSHMGLVSLSIFSLTLIGLEGSIILQMAHGLVSPALFIIVTLLYDRHHTRLIKYFRGVATTMPLFASLFLFFTLCNISVPLSFNFIGEWLSLLGVFQTHFFIAFLACSGMVLSACYALFLFNRVCFGSISPAIDRFASPREANRDLSRLEIYLLLPLAIPTIFFGLFPNFLLETLHNPLLLILAACSP